jgi:glycosyltransferase involved in cell wall biosynthesis
MTRAIHGTRPLVSVIIPTFNRAGTIARAVESVLAQTLSDLEVVVVDDGSVDRTPAALAAYRGHARVRLCSLPHRGSAAACNEGLRHARGRYVAFHGSDDERAAHSLETAVGELERSPEVGVFYSDMLRVPAVGEPFVFRSPDVGRGAFVNERTLDYAMRGVGSGAAVIRRECIDDVGVFDELLPRFVDLDLFIRLAWKFEFVHHAQPLVTWHAGAGISTDGDALVRARLRLLRKYHRHLAEHGRYLAGQYLQTALAYEEVGDVRRAWAFASKALLTSPLHPYIRRNALVPVVRSVRRGARRVAGLARWPRAASAAARRS